MPSHRAPRDDITSHHRRQPRPRPLHSIRRPLVAASPAPRQVSFFPRPRFRRRPFFLFFTLLGLYDTTVRLLCRPDHTHLKLVYIVFIPPRTRSITTNKKPCAVMAAPRDYPTARVVTLRTRSTSSVRPSRASSIVRRVTVRVDGFARVDSRVARDPPRARADVTTRMCEISHRRHRRRLDAMSFIRLGPRRDGCRVAGRGRRARCRGVFFAHPARSRPSTRRVAREPRVCDIQSSSSRSRAGFIHSRRARESAARRSKTSA